MDKTLGGRWAMVLLVVGSASGCLRLLALDNRLPDAGGAPDAAVVPVVLESLAVESARADAGPLTLLGYGGDVLRVVARGFDVAVQPRVLLAGLPLVTAPAGLDGGADDVGSLDADGGPLPVTLRVLLPEQKVLGMVEVVVGERLGRSAQTVSVLGRGHPDQPRMSGTLEPQMAIRSAGTTNIPCGPPISAVPDGGTEHAHCGSLQLDPGTVALAFSFGPTLVFREPTYLAQLNFFGGINRVLALPEEPYRNMAGVQAFTAAGDGPGFVTQDVVGLPDGGFLPRQVIHPAEGGAQDASVVEPAVPVGLRMGASDFVMLKMDHDAGPGFTPTRNGRDFYPSAAAPRIPGVPSAVGYVAQGYDPVGDYYGSATVVTAGCEPATAPRYVHVDRLLTEFGTIYSTRRAIPTTLRLPGGPAATSLFGCDVFLDGGLRPECEALARCPDCNTLPSCADDPFCRAELTDMLACAQNTACGNALRPFAACVATPVCHDALVQLLEGDAGNPCTSPGCTAALSCLQPGAECAHAAACLLDPRCVPPPSCALDGGHCVAKINCALDEACTAQAACESNGNCAEVESCYQHLCQGSSQEEGRGSFPRQLVPLLPGVMMVQEQPSPLPFNAAPQPLCSLELFTGTVFPLLPTDILAGAYAAVEDHGDNHTRLLMVPPGGNQLLVYDLQGQSLESSPTRTPYKQLVTDGVYPLVYAVPESGGRVDVLDSQGTFSGSIHALGPALVSFPLPAEDGRMLAFHQDFLLLTDGAGVVQQHLFRAFTPGALEPSGVANGIPAFAWTLRPPVPPEQDVMLERVSLSLDADLGTVTSTLVAPEGLRRANVVAVLTAGDAPRLLLQLVDAPDAPDHPCLGVGGTSQVPYLALLDTAVVPLLVEPITATCGHRAMAFHPALQQVLMHLDPDSGDYGTRRLDLSQATPTVLDTGLLLPALNAVAHPNGSFLGLFVNSVNGAFRLELGQVLGNGTEAYRTVAEVDFSEPVMTLSPDGERLYVGRSGSVLEVELSAESTHPDSWLNARTLRSIAIDGQADLLQMDSQGTRLLYLDYQHQLTGLVE